ncbi:flagellar basal-body rod protein FlgC [Monaibacterium marinum]|uniref:Flagellar basal-body rod protein FlgC n=1 Tax=Pontivivens marinum TaxID=1690039 RepID=A0A2C9CU98_9RHOB|nr:flagellar basal body rod protein FlgC [Monaibacterium marinum]SOH95091.1 flagellar basal-body rod protein FlgC [Monaibacterium marinum]
MSDLLSSMQSSVSGMTAQSARLRLSSENIANADTPGYHGKTVSFEEVTGREGIARVVAGAPELSQRSLERVYSPGHPLADDEGYYDGSNVNLMVEIADARQAQRTYEANLKMFDQARAMSSSLLDLLRR